MTTTGDWCEKALRYQFSDEDLLTQALTHRSASATNNERLEFLGDAALGLTVSSAIYDARPDADEGAMSRYRASLVRGETLAGIARDIGLGSRLRMGSGEHRAGGHQRASALANALEALFGAIFIDGGYGAARRAVLHVFGERLAQLPADGDLKDPKTRLQELLQARQLPLPHYSLASTSGADHERSFEARCRIDALDVTTAGHGTTRRKAEQAAAAAALGQLVDE
ncbi:MAG: ribonuclease III [Gammaproteobacteria bacterium]